MSDRCDHAVAHVYLYLDRELTWWRRRQIRRHVSDCPPCFDGFSFEQRLRVVVRQRLAEDVPAEFITRLRQVIDAERLL